MKSLLLTVVGLHSLLLAGLAAAQEKPFPLPPKDWPQPVMDRQIIPFLLVDRLEYAWKKGNNSRAWDIQGWFGGDYNKFWFKTEGEDEVGGRTEAADLQALYARRISPFWHFQTGILHEQRPSPSRDSVVFGVQGLAPYWFEVDAAAYLNRDGKLSGRLEAEYDLLLTQRLILQPRLETRFAGSVDRDRHIGRGFNDLELGIRLRYEIKREFAPYIGVTWSRKLGDTADFARQAGEDVRERAVVAGLRMWF